MPDLILASQSPRRKSLLEQIGITADKIIASKIDETPHKGELPLPYVKRVAKEKAMFVAKESSGNFILSADTTVACGRRILPKAEDDKQVRQCLKLLSGRQHSVITSVCLIMPDGQTSQKTVATKVKFKHLSVVEFADYIKSGEGVGKAGGYAIQGLAGAFVKSLNGSYSAVVGLPLMEVKNMLTGGGYE